MIMYIANGFPQEISSSRSMSLPEVSCAIPVSRPNMRILSARVANMLALMSPFAKFDVAYAAFARDPTGRLLNISSSLFLVVIFPNGSVSSTSCPYSIKNW